MTARWSPLDEPFFREWNLLRRDSRRSLPRAAEFGHLLGFDVSDAGSDRAGFVGHGGRPLPPVLTVVGSKGKGTAVAHATAALVGAGLTVGTITSPPFRRNSERIRVNGSAVSSRQYAEISARAAAAMAGLPPPDAGYLSPTGSFTVAGSAWLADVGVDVLVLEEGLGGSSDEVSLFAPEVVALTPVFLEHAGILGASVPVIAEDLLGVVSATTRQVWTAPQSAEVSTVLRSVCRRSGAAEGPVEDVLRVAVEFAHIGGLGPVNAALGVAAAADLMAGLVDVGELKVLTDQVKSMGVTLPGRLSVHLPRDGRQGIWVVDAAIDPVGLRAALEWTRKTHGEPVRVLGCFPDVKDSVACFDALRATGPVVAVTAGESYLRFDPRARGSELIPVANAVTEAWEVAGTVLCVGTMSFVGDIMDRIDVDTGQWW